MAPTKVLLVDEDSQFTYLVQRYAQTSGSTVFHASCASEATMLAQQNNPHLILIDITPGKSECWKILSVLKANPVTSQIPAYVCSASESAVEGWEDQADGCLIKPVMYEDFVRTLAKVTEQNGNRPTILEVTDLKKYFPIKRGFFSRIVGQVKAVDGVSFFIRSGETLGLVGESGCGKTTTGRCIIRILKPSSGKVIFTDPELGSLDMAALHGQELRKVRRNMQIIFQDPYSSLNPRWTLERIVGEPLLVNGMAKGKELKERVAELLKVVGLRPEYMVRYPHAFSGGQRQRIGIARAIAMNPRLVICDEPVSALDVSVQAQILNLLKDLQEQFRLTYLFVAHDLSVVKHISDRVSVMYVGKLVENASKKDLFSNPKHPYTEALLSAVPRPDPRNRVEPVDLPGEVANPAHPPTGCYFHPRCRYCIDRCKQEGPVLREIGPDHFVACHRAEELTLEGISG